MKFKLTMKYIRKDHFSEDTHEYDDFDTMVYELRNCLEFDKQNVIGEEEYRTFKIEYKAELIGDEYEQQEI